MSEDAQFIHILLNEPGDHEYDGVFDLFYEKETGDLTGSWEPNSPKLKSKTLNLKRIDADSERIDFWEDGEQYTVQTFISTFNGAGNSSEGEKSIYLDKGGKIFIEYYESLDTLNRSEQMNRAIGVWFVEKGEVYVEFAKNDIVDKGVHKVVISKGELDKYAPPSIKFDNSWFAPYYY